MRDEHLAHSSSLAIGTEVDCEAELDEDRRDVQSVDDVVASQIVSAVPNVTGQLFGGLSPMRCYNYDTQLRVAGNLISESLASGNSAVLILDKNAEVALERLESLGFTLRQALLDRKLDIFYYRSGVRDRTFFKKDYETIFNDALKNRIDPVQHLIMVEFNTLFANSVKEAVDNQIEDFCDIARCYDVAISGLYSPHSWYQLDFLTARLPNYLADKGVKEASLNELNGELEIALRQPQDGKL